MKAQNRHRKGSRCRERVLAIEFHKHLAAGSASDTGKVRDQNEDSFFVDVEVGLFIVSDGMGGAQAGALASEIVVKALPPMIQDQITKLTNPTNKAIRRSLKDAIVELSKRLHNESVDQIDLKGMGATVVLAMVYESNVHIAHMGDSRAYLLRQGRLEQLTQDHSIVGILLRLGDITPEEAEIHPARGRLSRFVGMEGEVYSDVLTLALRAEDRLLLCSDGLSGMVTNRAIADVLMKHPDPQIACEALVDAANSAGGKDNVTVVIIAYKDSTDR